MITMNTRLWASIHEPTQEQLEELEDVEFLSEVAPDLFSRIKQIKLDTGLNGLANDLMFFCNKYKFDLVQPAGSPAFMVAIGIAYASAKFDVDVIFAYSKRVSVDVPQADGSIVKTSVFKHEGFIKL